MEPTIRRVLPIRQDITYWFCFTGAETEIHKIKDDSKIKREKNINRCGQRYIVNVCHLSDPPSFSLPTTFKRQFSKYCMFLDVSLETTSYKSLILSVSILLLFSPNLLRGLDFSLTYTETDSQI